MEFSVPADDGNTAYTYAIARIGFADEGIADEVEVFNLLCSKASEKIAARKEKQVCIFDDYARLRAGVLDAGRGTRTRACRDRNDKMAAGKRA